jgi:pyrroloquinoline quinone biosynthesis protein B
MIKYLLLQLLFIVAARAQEPYVVVLGTAQDGGYPQAGCNKACCRAVWAKKLEFQAVSCIALVDPSTGQRWIFDATPDFKTQLEALKNITQNSDNVLSGIFLTHAHIGHYTGLMDLGREVMGAKAVPVYAMPRMKTYLESNGPWSQLVQLENIKLKELQENIPLELNSRLKVRAFRVPHRDEFSETVGFEIISSQKRLVFIPDIDKWQKWTQSLENLVQNVDYALLDGTFYKEGEINRPMSEVPHPFVTETISLLKPLPISQRKKVYFIHLNHTNPLLQTSSGEYQEVLKEGFHVAYTSQYFKL